MSVRCTGQRRRTRDAGLARVSWKRFVSASAYGPLLGGQSTQRRPRWTLAEQGQDVSAVLMPVREFIADVPWPGSDHRKHKPPTLLEQDLIDIQVVGADLVRHMRNIEFDGPAATRFEVDEQHAVLSAEQVAWMRFAVLCSVLTSRWRSA